MVKIKSNPKKKSFWWDKLTKRELVDKIDKVKTQRDEALKTVEDMKIYEKADKKVIENLEESLEFNKGEVTRLGNDAFHERNAKQYAENGLDCTLKSLARVLGENNGNN